MLVLVQLCELTSVLLGVNHKFSLRCWKKKLNL